MLSKTKNISNILLKEVVITDCRSAFNNKKADILISEGVITQIAENITKESHFEVLKAENIHVSPGWIDIHTHIGEPGYENRETLDTAIQAAISGGFTDIASSPACMPTIESKADILFLKSKAAPYMVNCHPIGAFSKNLEGKELTEMYDMSRHGAISFSDGKLSNGSSSATFLAMEFIKSINGVLMVSPLNRKMAMGGMVNESSFTLKLGLKGISGYAEKTAVQHYINMAEYIGVNIHFTAISAKESVDIIREYKKNSNKVTAGVTSYHLLLDETGLHDFDTNYKVFPPLRGVEDRQALIDGVVDGTIDVIISDHTPIEEECKNIEFDKSLFGMINLQTSFSAANMGINNKIGLDELTRKFSINPKSIFGLTCPVIAVGETACLTLYNPEKNWKFTLKDNLSLSKNSPFLDKKLKGRAIGIIRNNCLHTV